MIIFWNNVEIFLGPSKVKVIGAEHGPLKKWHRACHQSSND